MTRTEKNNFIDALTVEFNDNRNFYLTDLSGLSANDSNKFRRVCFNRKASVKVVKNTLLRKALEKTGRDYTSLYDTLNGNTAVIFTETGNIPARLITEFRKSHNKPLMKAACVEETLYIGDDQLLFLSELKSKNEMLAEIIFILQSPLLQVINGLQSGKNKIAGILKTIAVKK